MLVDEWCNVHCQIFIIRADCLTHRSTVARAKVVEEWSRGGGVLLMGYEMYRLLSMKKSFVMGKKRKTKKPVGPVIIDLDEEDRQQELMKGNKNMSHRNFNGLPCC